MSLILSRNAVRFLSSSDGGSTLEVSEELVRDAKNEATELLERFGSQCTNMHLAFQHNVALTGEDINDMFRTLHSLKGLARMINLNVVENLLHKVEDYVDAVRNGKLQFAPKDVEHFSDLEGVLERLFTDFPSVQDDNTSTAEKLARDFSAKSTGSSSAAAPAPSAPASTPARAATSAPSSSGGNGIETSTSEYALFTKYLTRNETLYAIVFPAGVHADLQSLSESEIASNIVTIGETILMRVTAQGALCIFAAELDLSMLSALFGEAVLELPKNVNCAKGLPAPWNSIVWADSGSSDLDAMEERISAPAPWTTAAPASSSDSGVSDDDYAQMMAEAEAMASTSPAPQAAAPAPAPTPAAAAPSAGHSEEDDFDSKNLATAGGVNELDPELLQDFISSADDLLEALGQSMLELESNPTGKDAIENIFRNVHTIKGTAGMFGFRAIEKLTHVMENLFDRIRKGQTSVTPAMMDGLLFGLDRVRQMFENIKKGANSEIAINDAIWKLKLDSNGNFIGNGSASNGQNAPAPRTAAASPSAGSSGSSGGNGGGDAPPPSDDHKHAEPAKEGKTEAAKVPEGSGTIRVDLKRLDGLVNLVGELVIDRTRFARIEEELRNKSGNSELSHQMSESVLLFGRHMNEVQNIIMKIRMVPVGTVFNKFSRVVRDISRQVGKEIDLHIEGGETELDKTLVEEISDPLVHLIRNSVDHGIELPDDRVAKGKNRRGSIFLRAFQDGNSIVISVQDDGKGLPVDKLRAKGLQVGLIKETDHLSDKEIFNLIFEPGFSTAEKITNISGRGVGMDVVKKNIVKLKGFIELDSQLGKGITTTIKLPLTLAIIPSLMVESYGESYAIPLANVIESIRITPDEIQHIGSADFVKLRDRVLPLLRLSDVFDLAQMDERLWYRVPIDAPHGQPVRKEEGEGEAKPVPTVTMAQTLRGRRQRKPRLIFVVVSVGEKRVGLIVDQLLGQQEIVVKSLGKLSNKQRGVAGGCVLGNGCVALVIDVGEIIEDFSQSKAGFSNRAAV